MALLARVPEEGSFVGTVLLPSVVLGAAIPLTLIPNTTVALAEVPHRLHGAAAGLVNVSRVLGGTVALALASALAAGLSDALVRTGVPTSTALTHGYRLSFALGALLFAAAAAIGLILIRRRPTSTA
jgi:hypothetical protein